MTPGAPTSQSRWLAAIWMLVLVGWFLALEVAHWNLGLATSYDLGIFSQIARDYAHGRLPVPQLLGYPAFADHFSPINVLWALPWLIWPDPRSLLILQAVSLAVGVVIMAMTARRELPGHPYAGWVVILVGALCGQTMPSVLFDVHEVSLGLPAMAMLCAALLARRPGLLVAASAALVLVKEDLGLTVAVAGALWCWMQPRRNRVAGVVTTAIGLVGLGVAAAAIGQMSTTGTSPQAVFFSGPGAEQGWGGYLLAIVTGRLAPLGLFIATAGIVGVSSRFAVLAVPTIAWRIVSSKPTHWGVEYHYDLLLWPVAVACLIEVYQRHWPSAGPRLRKALAIATCLGLIVSIAAGIGMIVHRRVNPVGILGQDVRISQIRGLAAQIPAGSRVAAANDMGVYLLTQYDTYQYSPDGSTSGAVDYLLTDATGEFALIPCAQSELDLLVSTGQAQVIAQDDPYSAIRLSRTRQLTARCP